MKNRIRATFIVTLALLMLVASTVMATAGGTKQIGLVIAFPDGTEHVEVLTVPVEATTFDVLQAASIKLASQNTQFGPAVCSINGVGCAAENCFCDPKRFWAYFHLDAAAKKWVAATEGVGTYTPADAAVEGFAWSEADANFAPLSQPPIYTFTQIQAASVSPLRRTAAWALPVALIAGVAALAAVLYARRHK